MCTRCWAVSRARERPAAYAPASFDLDATDNPEGLAQDVKEVWFPGNHADVGGGYPANESAPANNALRWMIAEARAFELSFDAKRYNAIFPREEDEPVTRRHDEMRDQKTRQVLWSVLQSARLDGSCTMSRRRPALTSPVHRPARASSRPRYASRVDVPL